MRQKDGTLTDTKGIITINKTSIGQDEGVVVSVTIKNIGDCEGEEVVQLYLRDVVRSITPPKRQLKGFKKILLKKGESKQIDFEIEPQDLKFYNSNLDFVSEPGEFQVFVGGNSEADLMTSFILN